jgi:tetratricopeptide (TPR) repeat protein
MGTSHTLNNISRLFIYQKEYDKALEYSTKSLEILKKVQDNRGIGNAHISLGSIYLSKNNVAEAIRMFSIAKDHFVKQGLKGHEGWALLKIANAHEADGKYQSALESCFAAMNLLDARQDLFSSIELYQTIGFIYAAQGDLTNSTEYLRQAIRLADRGHDGQGSMTSRLKMALVFKKFKHYDSALHYHEAYLQLYEETFTAISNSGENISDRKKGSASRLEESAVKIAIHHHNFHQLLTCGIDCPRDNYLSLYARQTQIEHQAKAIEPRDPGKA